MQDSRPLVGLMGGYPASGITQTAIPNPTPLQTALGVGTTVAGLYGAFSKPDRLAGNFNIGNPIR